MRTGEKGHSVHKFRVLDGIGKMGGLELPTKDSHQAWAAGPGTQLDCPKT